MATHSMLEEEITCSVCFEIYRDPHALKECLHTFCLPCIQQLERGGRVECPQCREYTNINDIKKDFKTQSLIDKVEKHLIQQNGEISARKCEMCENPEKSVKYRCGECNSFMCDACNKIHQKIDQSHKVTSVNGLIQRFQNKKEESVIELENEDKLVAKQSKKIPSIIEEITKSMNRQIQQVQQFTRDVMENLKEDEKRLTKLIEGTNKELVSNLIAKEQICKNSQQETQDKIKFLNEVIQTQDFNTLKETAECIDENIRESIKKIRAYLPDVGEMCESTVTVKINDSWDVTDFTQMHPASLLNHLEKSAKYVIKQTTDTSANYATLYGKEWNHLKSTETGHWCFKLCEINNDIWCAGSDKITVYNKQCERVKTITHHKLTSICAMAQYNTQVIATCGDKGLHSLTTEGQYIANVIEGSFSDVCAQGDYLFCLEINKHRVIVCKYSGQWEKVREISLQYGGGNNWDRLCVTQSTVCVSSWITKHIYTHNTEGQLLHKATNNNQVLLCDVDEEGSSLVAGYHKHNLYVVHNNTWHSLTLTGGNQLGRSSHALLDTDGNLWVGSHNNRLVKYSVKP